MPQRCRTSAVALALITALALGPPGQLAQAAISPAGQDKDARKAEAKKCRELRRAFGKGVRHFEKREWDEALEAMTSAMGAKCGKRVTVVVPYGRWVYDYTPGVYLGVSAARSAGCEGAGCKRKVDWWEEIGRPEANAEWAQRLVSRGNLLQCRVCNETGECQVEVDWWQRLARVGETVDAGLVEGYGGDCAGLSDIWTRVFTRGEGQAGMCRDMVGELGEIIVECADVAAGDGRKE